MSYRVDYDGMTGLRKTATGLGSGFRVMGAAFLLIFVLGVQIFLPEGRQALQDWFLPGRMMQSLAAELAEGVSLTDSLQDVCREAFAGAQAMGLG